MTEHAPHITERETAVDGLTIFSRTSAAPPANEPIVLLIHGLSVSSRPFLPTLSALAPAYRSIALDLPGFGRSSAPKRLLTVEEMAEIVARWMTAAGVHRAVIAGHSMGAQIAVELALRHPNLAAAVVLISPTGDPAARSIWTQLFRIGKDVLREPLKLSVLVALDYLRAGPRRSFGTLRLMHRHPMAQQLTALTVPALLIVGDRDPVAPHDWARVALGRLPNGRIVVIPGGAHGIQFDDPTAVAAAIQTFIETDIPA